MMIKRIICIVLCISLIMAGAVTASAFSDELPYFDLMDYGALFDTALDPEGTNTYSNSGEQTYYFQLPWTSSVFRIEFIVSYSSTNLFDSILFYMNGGAISKEFTRIYIGNDLYRYVLDLTSLSADGFSVGSIPIKFIRRGSPASITFHSFRVFTSGTQTYEERASCSVSWAGGDKLLYSDQGNSLTFSNVPFDSAVVDLIWSTSQWDKYDFLETEIILDVSGVISISASQGDRIIPVESNYIWNDASPHGFLVLQLRIDLRGCDRTSTDLPTLFITLEADSSGSTAVNYIAINPAYGYILADIPEPDVFLLGWLYRTCKYWFGVLYQEMRTQANNIINAIKGDSGSFDEFGDKTEEQAGELEQGNDALDNLEKPQIDQSTVDIGTIVSPDQMGANSSWLAIILNSQYISQIMTISLVLMMASYVLYGKKG